MKTLSCIEPSAAKQPKEAIKKKGATLPSGKKPLPVRINYFLISLRENAMKKFNLKKKFIVVTLCSAALLSSSTIYAASCERHIYNNSNRSWNFTNQPKAGNLHFSDDCPVNGPCKVKPGQTIAIRYTQDNGLSVGRTTLTDYKGVALTFAYGNQWGITGCPTADTGQSTGAVGINQPANGDYTIKRNGWYE